MKINFKFYRANIKVNNDFEFYIILVYDIGVNVNFFSLDFFRLIYCIDETAYSIPSNRQATFKEEIRVLNQSTIVVNGERSNEKNIIEEKLKEIYDSDITINISEITQEK